MKRVFVLSFLCLLGAAGRAVAAPVPDNSIDSIVKIYVVDLYGRPESWGSGVILDAQGDILTNFHVLDEAMSRPGWSWRVFPTAGAKSAPVQGAELRTTLVGTAPHLDLALLRATHVRNADGSYTDFREHFARGARRVPHVAFARHAHDYGVTLGEEIHVLGYPGAGDYSITYTKGTVSGFVQRDFDGVSQPWQLKTDAKLNHGNSGGAAFDAKENFIGVPSEIHSDQSGMDYMGYIIPLPVVDYFLDQQWGEKPSPWALERKAASVSGATGPRKQRPRPPLSRRASRAPSPSRSSARSSSPIGRRSRAATSRSWPRPPACRGAWTSRW
jgi:S1-C subfamily serine protease